jgi:hypothetical protein
MDDAGESSLSAVPWAIGTFCDTFRIHLQGEFGQSLPFNPFIKPKTHPSARQL